MHLRSVQAPDHSFNRHRETAVLTGFKAHSHGVGKITSHGFGDVV